eukprot:GEMP01010940.1.p1 GENE.GEMP01010940.1~~GEMP01010940.1.p1  ORF type:complete len:404 (-),score=78.21 GEMP01010940.1:2040-3251(-)
MTLSTAELLVTVVVPVCVFSIGVGYILARKCNNRRSKIYHDHAWTDRGRRSEKRYDMEDPEDGSSPRSLRLLKQLESLVGRVVENKLEHVLHSGKEEEYVEDAPETYVISTQTEIVTRCRISQTDQLDCLTPKPTMWLTPSGPQAAKDPIPDSARSTADPSDIQKIEFRSLRATAETLRAKMRARELQVQNLSKQLKDTRQKLWSHMEEQKSQSAFIRQKATENPGEHEAITMLNYKVNELSAKMNTEHMRACKWAMIAKQQREFLVQTESAGEPVQRILRRHPAGILFTAPTPYPEDDDYGDLWDVSNGAGANPYVVDSWPMEPNGLAQRCPKNVPFGENVVEESDESDYDSLSDKDDKGWLSRVPAEVMPGLRLPRLPAEFQQGHHTDQFSSRSSRSVRSL